jgi:hypothetical protein
VNNTQQDCTPYILTARHCFIDGIGPFRDPTTSIFRFLYWKPNCGSGTPTNWQSITGATVRAHNASTDFALLELSQKPPSSWNLYYSGWDRSTTPAQKATGIHHPRGDAMKICHSRNPVIAVSWENMGGLSYWKATFTEGIVQDASSGSPLFNQNNRIVGQLRGTQGYLCFTNDCHCSQKTPSGDYGRFYLSWTGGGTDATRLSNWLAPGLGNNAPQSLNGMVPCVPSVFISGPSSIPVSGTGNFYAYVTNNCPTLGTITYEWQIGPYTNSFYSSGNYASASFNYETTFRISVRATNACGTGSWEDHYVTVENKSPSAVVSPNPVSDILNIDVSPNARSANTVYDIRLYSVFGSQLRQTNTNSSTVGQLNVSNLPDGIYFLHIYDGVNSTPEVHRIIVKH